jgi:hypothetical protein
MEQVLWARSGYNSTVAANNGVFADRPTYVPEAPCVNVLDEQVSGIFWFGCSVV